MEIPTTTMHKGSNGWEAKTIILLPGVIEKATYRVHGDAPNPAQLEITTRKPSFGSGIQAGAQVVYKTPHGFRCAISFDGAGDYSRNITTDPKARCTEKKVREFHESAMAHLDLVLADVAKHYGVADLFTAPENAA